MKRLAPLLAFTLLACGSRPEGPYGVHVGDTIDLSGSDFDGEVTAVGDDWFEVQPRPKFDGHEPKPVRLAPSQFAVTLAPRVTCPH
jgi:hypothetical protein